MNHTVQDLPLHVLSLRALAAFAARCAERVLPLYLFATGVDTLRAGIEEAWKFAGGEARSPAEVAQHAGNLGVHIIALVQYFAGADELGAQHASLFGLAARKLEVRGFDLIDHLTENSFDFREASSGGDGVAVAAEAASKAVYATAYAAETAELPLDARSRGSVAVLAYVRARETAEISILAGGGLAAYEAAARDVETLARVSAPTQAFDLGEPVTRDDLPRLWGTGARPPIPVENPRHSALRMYLDLHALKGGGTTDLTGEIEERSLVLTASLEHRVLMFMASMLRPEFKSTVSRITYHVVPNPAFDVKVLSDGIIPHVFVSEGAVKLFEFVAHSTTFAEMVADETAKVRERSVFGPAMFEPTAVSSPAKVTILAEAFDRGAFPSAEQFVAAKAAEFVGATDAAIIYANTLLSCVNGSIKADFLRKPIDLTAITAGATDGIDRMIFAYLVSFVALHEFAHGENAPTDQQYAARAGLPGRTWSELAADALSLFFVESPHWPAMCEAARQYFGILQQTSTDYPDPLLRTSSLGHIAETLGTRDQIESADTFRDKLLEAITSGELEIDEKLISSYRQTFGTEETMFGIKATAQEKVAMYVAVEQWLWDLLERIGAGNYPTTLDPQQDAGLNEMQRAGNGGSGDGVHQSLEASFNLAANLHAAEGDEKNDVEVVRILEPIARQGFAPAQDLLGDILWSCKGAGQVPHDDKAAEEWYRLAAEQGLSYSQVSLGVMLLMRGHPAEKAEAVEMIESAARQGNPGALTILRSLREST